MALEGVHGSPEDVIVTVGSQQALDLLTRIFVDPGDVALAEAPSVQNQPLRPQPASAAGAIRPVPVVP